MAEEAKIEHSEAGAHAVSPGWFVLNIADSRWAQHDVAGRWTDLEPPDGFEPRYNASTPEETDTPRVAYSDWQFEEKPFRAPWPP